MQLNYVAQNLVERGMPVDSQDESIEVNDASKQTDHGIGPFRNWGEGVLDDEIGGFHPFKDWGEDALKGDDGGIWHRNKD